MISETFTTHDAHGDPVTVTLDDEDTFVRVEVKDSVRDTTAEAILDPVDAASLGHALICAAGPNESLENAGMKITPEMIDACAAEMVKLDWLVKDWNTNVPVCPSCQQPEPGGDSMDPTVVRNEIRAFLRAALKEAA